MNSKLWQVIACCSLLPATAAANSGLIQVTSIRSWSHPASTRVILETTGPFEYHSNRAYGPDRIFIDIPHARPWIAKHRYAARIINDALVKRVRVAETLPGTTRVVFDLVAPAEVHISRLDTPERLLIVIRRARESTSRLSEVSAARSAQPVLPGLAPRPYAHSEPALPRFSARLDRDFVYPPPKLPKTLVLLGAPALEQSPAPLPDIELARVVLPGPLAAHRYIRGESTRVLPGSRNFAMDAPAAPPSEASRSLTRALGLKINRIVIDAGHGGHDDGTIGPHGVLEKDVVLDVALRLAALVQSRMGAEVILTRSDDTFIPLHERTAIANNHKADLFLSIHANSSPSASVGGIETFYLNFTNNPAALDVAARENAGSDKTVGELKDLIQSITLNDKITESQVFARDVDGPLFAQAAAGNPTARDRGVKRAPFVVLIGASMPSVLAEIGFLSNSRDERNLRKPEYRQKIAEALYRGVSLYSKSLSHFEVAASPARHSGSHAN